MDPYFNLNQLCDECNLHHNLHRTIINEHLECFKCLLKEKKIDINERKCNNTPLYYAIMSKNIEYLKLLLENGALINETNEENCPLFILLFIEKFHKNHDIRKSINLLLKAGAEFNNVIFKTKYTPLFYACKHEYTNLELLNFYIENRANVNAIGPKSETILECIESKKVEFMKLILSAGANPNTPYSYNMSPLYKSILHNNDPDQYKKMNTLLKAGADINYKNKYGDTFLHIFSSASTNKVGYNIVKWLLNHNIQINICTRRFNSNAIKALILQQFWITPPIKYRILCFIDLYISGETIPRNRINLCRTWLSSENIWKLFFPKEINLCIICRLYIRKYFIDLYPHSNLKQNTYKLNLPRTLNNYLLFKDEKSFVENILFNNISE